MRNFVRQDFHTGYGMLSLWFSKLWVAVHWITMKTCRIPYETACRTGFRNLSVVGSTGLYFLRCEPLIEMITFTVQNLWYILGRGVNREGFNFKLAMVKTCSTWAFLNKYALQKKIEVGLQTPPSPQTPYIAYEKGQKLKIWMLFLPWSKCIHRNLKGIIITFKKLDVIYRPHMCVLYIKWQFLVKNGNFFTFGCCGAPKTLQIFH